MLIPQDPHLIVVQSRISQKSWERRVEKARKEEGILKKISKFVKKGYSLNKAIKKILPVERRSWAIRRFKQFQHQGIEALIDRRMPRCNDISERCKELVNKARIDNPKLTYSQSLEILTREKVNRLPSMTTIKREFQKADRKRRSKVPSQELHVTELPAAGCELLLAAELETGIMSTLTDEMERLALEAREASEGLEPERDLEHRDENGRFTPSYNQARKRKPDEAIASYLRPAEEKGAAKVPAWPRFVREKRPTLHRKTIALTFESLLNQGRGWNGLLAPGLDEVLETICGYAYMPSTLSKLTSALAQTGAGEGFLEVLGHRWHEVATERWHEQGSMVVLYVDNHAKEVWSNLFTKAGKVSHRSRVMPCITTTYVHTGAGAPVYIALQSGSAPLAPQLARIVEHAEKNLDEQIKGLTVIDAEGSTFDVFSSFIKKQRIIVTPMRANQRSSVDLRFGRGSHYRPFREHDHYRVGQATLHHNSSGRSLELDAVLIKREGDGKETVLLSNCSQLDVHPRVGAEAYFKRWSVQENAFKDGAVSVKLNNHRGKCSRMVTNVAVVDELERLEGRIITSEQKLGQLNQTITTERAKVEQLQNSLQQEQHKEVQANATILELRDRPSENAQQLATAALSFHESLERSKKLEQKLQVGEKKLREAQDKRETLREKIENMVSRCDHLEPMQQIRELDVSLDMLLTTFKLAATLLITFALREYLSCRPMTPETFRTRILSLRGRRIVTGDEERIIFFENPRDEEMNAVIKSACVELNCRKLKRGARSLIYESSVAMPSSCGEVVQLK